MSLVLDLVAWTAAYPVIMALVDLVVIGGAALVIAAFAAFAMWLHKWVGLFGTLVALVLIWAAISVAIWGG
jgi:hypothetical protein